MTKLHKSKGKKKGFVKPFPLKALWPHTKAKLPTMVLIYLINTLLFVDHNLHRTSCCTLKRVQTGLA